MASVALVYLFLITLVLAGALDVMTMRIPNWLTAGLAVLFIPAALASGMPYFGVALHVAAGVGLFVLGYCLFVFGVFGGGDAKLMAAVGLWLGFPVILPFLLFTALAGGLLAVGIGLWSLSSLELGARSSGMHSVLGGFMPNLPYGFALACGGLLAMTFSWWMGPLSG